MDFANASNDELIGVLRTCGLDVPAGLPEAVVARGESIVPALCDFVADLDQWMGDRDDPAVGWGPLHAAHLLGAIGDARAFDAIVAAMAPDDDCSDALMDDAPAILASLGPAVLPAMKRFVLEAEDRYIAKWIVFDAIVALSLRHPEHRFEAADSAREYIAQLRELDEPFPQFLLTGLVLSDRDDDWALAMEVYESDEGDDIPLYDISDLRQMRREGLFEHEREHYMQHPLDYFTERSMALLRHQCAYPVTAERKKRDDRIVRDAQRKLRKQAQDERAAQAARNARPGGFPGTLRNAPCPCGSGRKYKKCCMP